MSTETLLAIAEIAAVVIAATAIIVTGWGIRDQLWIITFTEYTGRYAQIVRELPSEARDPGGGFDMKGLTKPERDGLLNVTRNYINLCSEEFYLRSRRKIDKETWSIWETGIRDMFRLPWFAATWESIRDEYAFYPDFRTFIDKIMEQPSPERLG
jgi:hypothetical protein